MKETEDYNKSIIKKTTEYDLLVAKSNLVEKNKNNFNEMLTLYQNEFK